MTLQTFKIFDKYEITQIEIKDPGLKSAINLEPKLILKSYGRNVGKFRQKKVNIVERLMNKLSTAGHRGKKHKIEKGNATGKYTKNMNIVLKAFGIIEKRTGKNPVEVLVKAIENSSPRDEVTVIGRLPVAEMFGLSNDLRSGTGGRGSMFLVDQSFERVPGELQGKILGQIRSRKGLSEGEIHAAK